MAFAVIKTGGKQYLVEPGQKLRVEKLMPPKRGKTINFEEVLLVGDGGGVKIGAPLVSKAKVVAEWLNEGKAKKKLVFRYHSKTRYRKKKGHRQPYTQVLIKEIKT